MSSVRSAPDLISRSAVSAALPDARMVSAVESCIFQSRRHVGFVQLNAGHIFLRVNGKVDLALAVVVCVEMRGREK